MEKVIIIVLALLIINIPIASANNKDGENERVLSFGNESKAKVEIKLKNQHKEDSKSLTEAKVEINNKEENKQKVKIDENEQALRQLADEFEITGEITTVVGNNFVVAGHTIFIDPSQVHEFKQKGILEVGNRVKVKGIIKNDIKFAREINVLGTGQGRFKFEIKGLLISTSSITPTSSPTSSISTTPSPISTSSARVKIKANGPLDQITSFIQQILNILQSLTS